MRLRVVERGRLTDRARFAFIRVASGFRVPDVVRTLAHRPDFFGRHQRAHTQAVMRGPSAWTVGERELFAAFVSRLNRCHF
jgi:hypothetical protein